MLNKIVYLFVISLVLLSSCKNKGRRIFHRSAQQAESEVSVRDHSITKANAYNDLFLDSSAMEKFISTNVFDDSITENMRDFYNVRNFEFAWFACKHITGCGNRLSGRMT